MNQLPKVSYGHSNGVSMIYHVVNIHDVASTEQIDKAKEVIKKLTFEFQSDSFENPGTCIQKTHAYIHVQVQLKCVMYMYTCILLT